MPLLGLSAGHKIGLGVMGLIFVVFALVSALLVPRYRPDFPGRAGIRVFVIVALALFVAMMAAVTVFGRESEAGASEKGGTGTETTPGGSAQTVDVTAKDFRFTLPSTSYKPGQYTFQLKNDGPSAHNLVVKGPGVSNASTPTIAAGKTASVKATLKAGTYELYCSVPGHKQLGMDVNIKVA
jgi:plastocyanin